MNSIYHPSERCFTVMIDIFDKPTLISSETFACGRRLFVFQLRVNVPPQCGVCSHAYISYSTPAVLVGGVASKYWGWGVGVRQARTFAVVPAAESIELLILLNIKVDSFYLNNNIKSIVQIIDELYTFLLL